MNDRFFACPKCKTYTSAGYRWAYWLLERTGIVEINGLVNFTNVLSAKDYWNPPPSEQSAWLNEQVFPLVRVFLSEHADHGILYFESGDFFGLEDFESWVEIEYE
jgi:hypothetical protein